MLKIRGLRWWMIVLIMLSAIINYLTRSTLAVAYSLTLGSDLHITAQQYSWIIGAFQGTIMLQPLCGYVLDVLGLRRGMAIFALAWSMISMSHGFAQGWRTLAALRGLLGLVEGSANPAGMKATSEWFPARERGLAGGIYNIGASVGSMVAAPLVTFAILFYNWRAAFVVTGALGLIWVALWLWFYESPAKHPKLSDEEREYIAAGQEQHLQSDGTRPSIISLLKQRNFWGIAMPRFLADPTWGTLQFWLPIYLTSVRHFDPAQIDGEWSDPIYLNSSGFDPSLFHDDDGKKYLVNMLWDHRPGQNRFAGIVLQEYSVAARTLISDRKVIFEGTSLGLTEAPHLYKRNGYYYLLTAEGGTGWSHAVTMARSRALNGPYELHPDVYILSSRNRPDVELQRAGHADLVETQNGETYMVYLCGRPLRNRGRCTLGRETAIQPMTWSTDGWLRTTDGQGMTQSEVAAPALPVHVFSDVPTREEFDDLRLPLDFQWLRSPWPEELFSLTARPGHLRLYGRETMGSLFRQALVARRQQSHCFSATTVLEFEPLHFQQMAGLICYYSGAKFHYLYVSHDETFGKHLRVMSALPDQVQSDAFSTPVSIPRGKRLQLRVEVDYERLYFGYRIDDVGGEWCWLPQQFDASILSDEATAPGAPNFTGAFVGMCCQDLAGTGLAADFDYFEYRERKFRPNPFLDL